MSATTAVTTSGIKRKSSVINENDPNKRTNASNEDSPLLTRRLDQSDEEPPAESADEHLNWRQNPEDSLSDWTIKVVTRSLEDERQSKIDTYHVHKILLATGPRRSEYFVRLLRQGGRFAESQNSTSRVELQELAAKAFPLLLDFLYSLDADLFKTCNTTALFSLAEYFEMKRLRWEASQFFHKDLSPYTCGTYYEHAMIIGDDKILKTVRDFIYDNIMEITVPSQVVQVTDAQFWLDLIKTKTMTTELSLHLSTLIAQFCQLHDVAPGMFVRLTSEDCLPEVHAKAALTLMEAEREVLAATEDKAELSSLQKRCIGCLANNWEKINLDDIISKHKNPLVLHEFMSCSLTAAKQAKRKIAMKYLTIKEELRCFHRLPNHAFGSIMSCSAGPANSLVMPQMNNSSKEGLVGVRVDASDIHHAVPLFCYLGPANTEDDGE